VQQGDGDENEKEEDYSYYNFRSNSLKFYNLPNISDEVCGKIGRIEKVR
jgi:hypothetical protein